MVVNEGNEDDSRYWMLGSKKVHRMKSCKYIGMMMDEKEYERTKYEKIQ